MENSLNKNQITNVEKVVYKIKNELFNNVDIDLSDAIKQITKDYEYQLNHKSENIDGIYALIIYRISKQIIDEKKDSIVDFSRIKSSSKNYTSSYISPFAQLDCPTGLFGKNIIIGNNFKIGKYVSISNNCQLIDKNHIVNDNIMAIINSASCLKNDVKVYSGVVIGCNVVVNDNCIIREDVADFTEVSLISDFQVKKIQNKNYLPSQELIVYGVVPKFKNTMVIYGEGFYNPKVKLVVPNSSLEFQIVYWDKNKIIVKIDYCEIKSVIKNTLVIFSNGQRITLTNNIGIQKTLKNLKK